MKSLIIFFTILFVLSFAANIAYSSEKHHHSVIIEPSETTIINNQIAKGVALAISVSQIDCNHSTRKWQGGVGFGFYDSETAISGGVCKRFKDTLIKSTIGVEDGKIGAGIGIMFQFN
jgi:hypothetical protein